MDRGKLFFKFFDNFRLFKTYFKKFLKQIIQKRIIFLNELKVKL